MHDSGLDECDISAPSPVVADCRETQRVVVGKGSRWVWIVVMAILLAGRFWLGCWPVRRVLHRWKLVARRCSITRGVCPMVGILSHRLNRGLGRSGRAIDQMSVQCAERVSVAAANGVRIAPLQGFWRDLFAYPGFRFARLGFRMTPRFELRSDFEFFRNFRCRKWSVALEFRQPGRMGVIRSHGERFAEPAFSQ